MSFSQGHSGTKVQCESCLFSLGKTPKFINLGEIHELFVLAPSLVWFAGVTPDETPRIQKSTTPSLRNDSRNGLALVWFAWTGTRCFWDREWGQTKKETWGILLLRMKLVPSLRRPETPK